MTEVIKRAFIGYLALFFLAVSLEYSFYRLMPIDFWFEEGATVPFGEDFSTKRPLAFVAEYTFKRTVDIEVNHVLYCRSAVTDNEFVRMSGQLSLALALSSSHPGELIWIYHEFTPTAHAAECYLDKVTTLLLPYGIGRQNEKRVTEKFKLAPGGDNAS